MQEKDTFLVVATEHFRMSAVYWGVTGLYLLGHLERLDPNEIVDWVMQCQHENGGFGGSERHAAHILYTFSAVQILAMYGELDRLDKEQVASCEQYFFCAPGCRDQGVEDHCNLSFSWYLCQDTVQGAANAPPYTKEQCTCGGHPCGFTLTFCHNIASSFPFVACPNYVTE